ncbi:hypothetical protein BDV96DRAFT_644411 [Lophiotrema nucula]|uniref:F-box domain-containing protein n=1 Tax=Lophiotrema nucula TaxID=690887 RepID=A0A6A5ZF37_9PLEO|nr:hypothetical protein BDV96DRAFT_644411 [Lophiotrema nucula]
MSLGNPIRLHLTAFPAELLLGIYEVLPSFADALTLSATCHTLHSVWAEHRTAIVEAITNQFECYRCARELLASRRNGVPLEHSDLSDRELYGLAQYARRIDRVIQAIEHDYIPKLQIDALPQSQRITIYGENEAHPPKLTQTERIRVIRACYQIWALIHRDRDFVRAHIASMPPRQWFYLAELKLWALNNGFPTDSRWDLFQISKATSRAIKGLFWGVHHCREPALFQDYHEVPVDLVVIWDHWQDNLKSVVCGRPLSDLRRDAKAQEMAYLWDFEPGDEYLVIDDEPSATT